ncbi:MAG TPA: RraA family protein, partial [Cyclobacteriaceae bacterium]|nr:RraA family protein [Cyclobacteriaceae bacterium]
MKKLIKVLVVILVIWHPSFSQEKLTDEQILKLFDGLRVADVSDGLDMVGLRDAGLMDTNIEALWKDIDSMKHFFCGIAVTARYVPTNRVMKNPMPKEEFQKWEGDWYGKISSEPFVEFLKPGSVVVLDVQGDGDTGSVGSNNGLSWYSKGARGIISNGGIRDTDELIKEKIPVYLDHMNRGRGIRPGRNEIESVNKPITVGGVLVRPGDVVVADG